MHMIILHADAVKSDLGGLPRDIRRAGTLIGQSPPPIGKFDSWDLGCSISSLRRIW